MLKTESGVPIPFGIDEQFRMSEVKRWHVINTAREQTLADHSFQVAMLIRQMLIWSRVSDPWSPLDSQNLLEASLLHDAHEVWVGDRPTCAKQYEPVSVKYSTAEYGNLITNISDRRRGQAIRWIALADSMEALVWLNQNAVGAHAKSVISELLNRVSIGVVSLPAPIVVIENLENYLNRCDLQIVR